MKRLAVASLIVLALSAPPALAVNDPVAVNNPGKSTGARGQAQSQALAHCQNATP